MSAERLAEAITQAVSDPAMRQRAVDLSDLLLHLREQRFGPGTGAEEHRWRDGPTRAGGVHAGQRVLWAVLNAYDGRGQPTVLSELVLSRKGLAHPLDLLRLLSEGARHATFGNARTFEECIADELVLAANNDVKSFAVSKRNEMERVAMANR